MPPAAEEPTGLRLPGFGRQLTDILRSRTVPRLEEAPREDSLAVVHKLTGHCRTEFEEALQRRKRLSSQNKFPETAHHVMPSPLHARQKSRSLVLPAMNRSKTFHVADSRVHFAPVEIETSGPSFRGGLLHPDLMAEARANVHTRGGRLLDSTKRVTGIVYKPAQTYNLENVMSEQGGPHVLMFTPKQYVMPVHSTQTSSCSLPNMTEDTSETTNSTLVPTPQSQEPAKRMLQMGAAGSRVVPTSPKSSTKESPKPRFKNKKPRHWTDKHTVSSEGSADHRQRMQDVSELYSRMFGFTTIKRGVTKVHAKTRSIKEIAAGLPVKKPSALSALHEAAVANFNSLRGLPSLSCPSSEIKSREVAVSRWLAESTSFARSRTSLPIV